MFTVAGHLNFNTAAKTATFVDDTVLSTLNLAQVQVTGTATIAGPDGVAIASGLTIDRSAGDTATASFNLPLDNTLGIYNGTYTFTYVLNFVVAGFSVAQFTATNTITVNGVDWANIFNYTGAVNDIIIAGATTPGNDGTYGVGSATLNAGNTDFVVTGGTVTTEAGGGATIDFDVDYPTYTDSHTYTGCDEATLSVATPYYCNTTRRGSIIFEDTTVLPTLQTLVSRLWNISYPGGLTNPVTPADITSSIISVTVPTLATGQWVYLLTYNVSVTQADGLVYTYTVSKTDNVDVECVATLCELRCGIQELTAQYAEAVNGGSSVNKFTLPVSLVSLYWINATNALTCGDQTKFTYYAGLIQTQLTLLNIACGCGCDDENSTTEGNHWIDNGTDSIYTATPQSTIFELGGIVTASSGLSPDGGALSTSLFGSVSVPPGYFQLAGELNILGLTNGKKFINIEYVGVNVTGGTATSTLALGGNAVVNAESFTIDQLEKIKVKVGTRVSGTDTIFTVQVFVDKVDGNLATSSFSAQYYEFTNLIDAATNLAVLHTAGGAQAANLCVFDVKIYPSQQI